jgi:hypothetical protein
MMVSFVSSPKALAIRAPRLGSDNLLIEFERIDGRFPIVMGAIITFPNDGRRDLAPGSFSFTSEPTFDGRREEPDWIGAAFPIINNY